MDGEFWYKFIFKVIKSNIISLFTYRMSFTDFMYWFDVVQMCHLTLDSFSNELLEFDDDSDISWKCTTVNHSRIIQLYFFVIYSFLNSIILSG